MSEIGSEQEKTLQVALKADISTLYTFIGHIESQKQLGAAPLDRKALLESGKEWFEEREKIFKELLCNNEKVKKIYSLENKSDEEKIEAILLIADLIVTVCSGIPAIYLSTLLLKIGLKELCNAKR